jgi:hypothetical protein
MLSFLPGSTLILFKRAIFPKSIVPPFQKRLTGLIIARTSVGILPVRIIV